MLVGLVAVFLLQQLPEDAEGHRRLQSGAGLGDDVHVEIHVPQPIQSVAEGVGREHVAHKEYLGIVLAGQGLEELYGPTGAQVRAADAHYHQGLGTAAYLLGGGDYLLQLRLLYALGQLHPAGKLAAQAALLNELLVGKPRQGIVGSGAGEKLGCAR